MEFTDISLCFFAVAVRPPPAQITDLTASLISFDNRTVQLDWTATGAALDSGTGETQVLLTSYR